MQNEDSRADKNIYLGDSGQQQEARLVISKWLAANTTPGEGALLVIAGQARVGKGDTVKKSELVKYPSFTELGEEMKKSEGYVVDGFYKLADDPEFLKDKVVYISGAQHTVLDGKARKPGEDNRTQLEAVLQAVKNGKRIVLDLEILGINAFPSDPVEDQTLMKMRATTLERAIGTIGKIKDSGATVLLLEQDKEKVFSKLSEVARSQSYRDAITIDDKDTRETMRSLAVFEQVASSITFDTEGARATEMLALLSTGARGDEVKARAIFDAIYEPLVVPGIERLPKSGVGAGK